MFTSGAALRNSNQPKIARKASPTAISPSVAPEPA